MIFVTVGMHSQGFDRLIKLELMGEQKRSIIVELFGKGNLVVLDEKERVIYASWYRKMRDRDLLPGKPLTLPPSKEKALIEVEPEDLNEEWLNKYERMIHRVSDPIVPVMEESCSACYYAILRQDLQKLKKSGVLPCRNCYRLLYYDEKEEEESKKESF